jgi:hypothetical protein
MESHPIATAEQHEHERKALELTQHPIVKEAFERVRSHWLEEAAPSPDMRACFDAAFEEVMFSAAIWSLNQDPLRPKVISITRLAHRLGKLQIPGSRWGIDNPDSIYRVIPISGSERYLIRGRVGERRMTENYFTLWDQKMNTVEVLSGGDLELEPGRSFTITVDSDPANGRPNHIRSAPEAHEFYIRDVMLDWANDDPNELSIERLGGPPSTPALTEDEQAELTASFMLRYANFTLTLINAMTRRPANEFSLAYSADKGGALRKQVYIGGHFRLDEDESLVIDVSDGGARYFVVPISNIWGTTLDIVNRTSSLNKEQSVPNADGTYTYVLSRQDPGVYNWIDPCDMGEGILTLRMAEFPVGRPNEDLSAKSQGVPFTKLRDTLPAETKWVTPAERAEQLAERAAGYKRRLPES